MPPVRNQTKLHLPFTGEWSVFWGGYKQRQNWHNPHGGPGQKFAFDFVREVGGLWYRGNVPKNENSLSFGRQVLAPAAGEIVLAVGDVVDHKPVVELTDKMKQADARKRLGNFVIIKHQDDEYSILAHLRQHKVNVRAGQNVGQGELIGLCGNSGTSTDPHLHYHMQNTPDLEAAEGIKPYFSDIFHTRNGLTRFRRRVSPVKRDSVEQYLEF